MKNGNDTIDEMTDNLNRLENNRINVIDLNEYILMNIF